MSNDYLSEMLLALKANIEYLKREGSAQLTVKNGQLLNTIGDIYVYEFVLDFFHDIEPDTNVELRVRNDSAYGRVIAISEKNIQVELDKNMGPTIPEARLLISSYYLLQLLYEKLEKVKSGEVKLTDLAEKTFRLKEAYATLEADYQIPYSSISELPNASQKEAIKLAIGSEISFIWGPPGTGKTQTTAQVIEGFLTNNLSVLLIAHTNIATDGALLDVVKHLKDSDEYRDGKLLREGNIQKQELKEYEMVIPSVVLEKKGISIKDELAVLERRIEQVSAAVSESEKIIKQFVRIDSIQVEEESIRKEINDKEAVIKSASDSLKYLKRELLTVEGKIARCQSMGTVGRFFSGLNLEKLVEEKSTLLFRKGRVNEKILLNKEAILPGKSRLEKLLEEKDVLIKQVAGENLEKHRKIVDQSQIEIKNLREQKILLEKKLEELANTLIKEAKVVATTLTKSYMSKVVLDREYDCVIIDEASMAPLPALWCAAGLAKQKVVIVGDFRQLPPIVKHKALHTKDKTQEAIEAEEALIDKWLKRDIFNFWDIDRSVKAGCWPDCLKQLKVQYRMHPEIADVVNTLIYRKMGKDCELESAKTTNYNNVELFGKPPLENSHVGIYNTNKVGSRASRAYNSYYNLYNAFLSIALAKQAISSGYKEIGIISPYRPQVNLIKKILKDENLDSLKVSIDTASRFMDSQKVAVNTVHGFQGSERQIIIFDLTTADPTKLADDQLPGGDDEKLINVAFSRAKEKFILIADIEDTLKKHSDSSLIREFINYSRGKNIPVISSENILPSYSVTQKTEKWLGQIYDVKDVEEIEKSKLFDETDFYQHFMNDLIKAKTEVIIDSPYITAERTRTFIPIFQHLIRVKSRFSH